MQKTIFITGASAGLGKATAKLFQSKGWKVIATMRNPEKETELFGLKNVTLLPLDVTNLSQIQAAAEKAISEGVDVVFNNAGYGLIGPLEALADEQLVKQLNTNLLGVIRVTQAFIPYFRAKKEGLLWVIHKVITTQTIKSLVNGLPTVEYLADQVYLSARYLSDMLRALTGQNTQQFIHGKLIEKAKEKLSSTQLSVSEIAYELGFEHPQSFSKLFKTKTSLSPLEFRHSFD